MVHDELFLDDKALDSTDEQRVVGKQAPTSGVACARSIASRSSYQSSAMPSMSIAIAGMSCRERSATMSDCT
jgi:hypothetical protein